MVVVVGAFLVAVAAREHPPRDDVRAGPVPTSADLVTTTVPSPPGTDRAGWPDVLTAATRSEVLIVAPPTGEVIRRFQPAGLADGNITGAAGAADGRISVWSGPDLVVSADGATYELPSLGVADTAGGGELRALFVPTASAVWITRGSPHTTVWRWDYEMDLVEQVPVDLPTGMLPAGVTDDGRLVLNSESPLVDTTASTTITTVGPGIEDEPTTFDGSALAVHRNDVLVRRCTAGACVLESIVVGTGATRPVDTGDVDPASVRSLIGPTVPSASAPLPTGDPGSARVLVGVAVGPEVPQDQPTVVGVIDLEARRLTLPAESPRDVAAAVWSCDGSDVLVLRTGRTVASLSGSITGVVLPEGTFLYGVGSC
jgi:hypothetical protein